MKVFRRVAACAAAAVITVAGAGVAAAAPTSADYTAGTVPGMGVSVFVDQATSRSQCTIGWPIRDNANNAGFLSAGHCVVKNPTSRPYMYTDAADPSKKFYFDPYSHSLNGVADNGVQQDAAVMYMADANTPRRVEIKSRDGQITKVSRVMPREEALQLLPGTEICQAGSRSGVVCGPLIKASDDSIRWGGLAVHGDSGSAVFKREADGAAAAIGILSYGNGETDYDNTAVYVEPLLRAWGLRLDNS